MSKSPLEQILVGVDTHLPEGQIEALLAEDRPLKIKAGLK